MGHPIYLFCIHVVHVVSSPLNISTELPINGIKHGYTGLGIQTELYVKQVISFMIAIVYDEMNQSEASKQNMNKYGSPGFYPFSLM